MVELRIKGMQIRRENRGRKGSVADLCCVAVAALIVLLLLLGSLFLPVAEGSLYM